MLLAPSRMLAHPVLKIGSQFFILDDAPWTWKGKKADVYDNVWKDLDTEPVKYHYGEPVDPTVYQDEYIGKVIGIY
eukprot:CAMPEP_0174925342 /NCGR_PEP_ID=MMETSP1355-20121228/7846_1 /TAXON_ID=464990 /ORGANISM="Hemiselmis tepida, Strain CCMP443" /LENGTH=75 /DNA_ID=CAMNT_0016171243 /DNA_START=32 /DNA_END=259 /DNA_ORIENTATION=-